MKNLVLHQLNKGLYQDNIACAYIYYGSSNQPEDQNGKSISTFYSDPFKLQNYLKHTVLPIINQGLKHTAYQATDVSFENQAPHPFIEIMRRDKQNIYDKDLTVIKDRLLKITNSTQLLNQQQFFTSNKTQQTPEPSQHSMTLRKPRGVK